LTGGSDVDAANAGGRLKKPSHAMAAIELSSGDLIGASF
jgi:hypothetical protein